MGQGASSVEYKWVTGSQGSTGLLWYFDPSTGVRTREPIVVGPYEEVPTTKYVGARGSLIPYDAVVGKEAGVPAAFLPDDVDTVSLYLRVPPSHLPLAQDLRHGNGDKVFPMLWSDPTRGGMLIRGNVGELTAGRETGQQHYAVASDKRRLPEMPGLIGMVTTDSDKHTVKVTPAQRGERMEERVVPLDYIPFYVPAYTYIEHIGEIPVSLSMKQQMRGEVRGEPGEDDKRARHNTYHEHLLNVANFSQLNDSFSHIALK